MWLLSSAQLLLEPKDASDSSELISFSFSQAGCRKRERLHEREKKRMERHRVWGAAPEPRSRIKHRRPRGVKGATENQQAQRSRSCVVRVCRSSGGRRAAEASDEVRGLVVHPDGTLRHICQGSSVEVDRNPPFPPHLQTST